MSWHGSLGIWILVFALFLSVTGITWSTYGGANVSDLRTALNWKTPSVSTNLTDAPKPPVENTRITGTSAPSTAR